MVRNQEAAGACFQNQTAAPLIRVSHDLLSVAAPSWRWISIPFAGGPTCGPLTAASWSGTPV